MSVAISYRKSCTKSISYRKNGFLVVLRVHHRAFHYKIIILSAKHHYKNIIMSAKHPYKIIIIKTSLCQQSILIKSSLCQQKISTVIMKSSFRMWKPWLSQKRPSIRGTSSCEIIAVFQSKNDISFQGQFSIVSALSIETIETIETSRHFYCNSLPHWKLRLPGTATTHAVRHKKILEIALWRGLRVYLRRSEGRAGSCSSCFGACSSTRIPGKDPARIPSPCVQQRIPCRR